MMSKTLSLKLGASTTIHYWFRVGYLMLLLFVFMGCEKDNISRSVSDAELRQDQLVIDLKHALQDAEDGWVMMLRNNLSSGVAVPVVMKFDTLRSVTDIVTVYGFTDPGETYFRIEKGVSHPLLTFTTGSVITALYRLGATASDLTDHIFKVLAVDSESITIQCYRGGGVYSAEGGTIYKLFKRPKDWKWADQQQYLDLDNSTNWPKNIYNGQIPLTLTYANGTANLTTRIQLRTLTDPVLTSFRRNDPFVRDASAFSFQPFRVVFLFYSGLGLSTQTSIMLGHNSLSFYPFTVSQNPSTSTNVRSLIQYIGTNYLIAKEVVREGSKVKINFVAYDLSGNEVITAQYAE